MSQKNGKFTILYAGTETPARTYKKESIFIGRLDTCDIVLERKSISRIHAGINFRESKYFLVNLSTSNVLTLNGRRLGPTKSDVLADGDTIQIGQFTILAEIKGREISLTVQFQFAARNLEKPVDLQSGVTLSGDITEPKRAGVLSVFWKKRTRDDKGDWGTRLRPTEEPIPGKAIFNWKPTRDLLPSWRFGLFIWAFLIVGVIGVFAYFRYPVVYAPKPLSTPHASKIEGSMIALTATGNSCTSCHVRNEPIENSCIKCHQAQEFHASNTKAHEEAGITCTVCHREHQGADFQITATAIQSCELCHNDNNSKTYNGKKVYTAHDGSYGYPVVDGKWRWTGVYRVEADVIPEIKSSATGDIDEQAKLSRQFHTVHVYRLKAPVGVKGDSRGFVSCSSCHKSFDPIDRTTPRQTCAACHTTPANATNRDQRFGSTPANCISCHVQHPLSSRRWNEFLTDDALNRRRVAVAEQIKQLNDQ
jgi:pSer/pThr/pTyr-binding forkhead associated (FHA) protein